MKSIQQKRRLRYRRRQTGKCIELSARDIEIFKLLQHYRYLRSTFIHAFVGGDKVKLIQRLGDLFHEAGYIGRPKQQWRQFNARYAPVIYELADKGEHLLRQLGMQGEDVSSLVRRGRMGANRQFDHAMMVCDTLASIELGLKALPGVRFVSWQEIIDRAPRETRRARNPFALPVQISYSFARTGNTHQAKFSLVPDGLFGLEYTHGTEKSYRFFALEAERTNRIFCSNLRQTSWLKKMLAYRDTAARLTHQSHFGLPNLLVMAVAATAARIERMKRLVLDVTDGKGSTLFLFRHMPTLGSSLTPPRPMPTLVHEPWERAGRDPFNVDRP